MKYDSDLFVTHLSKMVQFPTVSCVDPDDMDMEAFLGLHKYLEEAYPLVHKTFTKEVIGRAGLLYTWKGTGKSGKLPILLAAHQDVVPEGDHDAWKYPPFSGAVEEGFIWGRGSNDSKINIQAYMDAFELLIADGFVPDYDIYMAFGYNEEIMGGPHAAAAKLADTLAKRDVKLGLVLDETANAILKINGEYVANIYPCEKGYADFEFSYEDAGGHAAMPGEHSALGIIGKTACLIEENPLPQKLTPPVVEHMKALAPFVDSELSELFKDPVANWEKLKPIVAERREYNAITRTTTAVTMAKGSDQANILPEKAILITNSRLLPGDTIEDLQKHFESFVPDGVKVRLLKGHNPPPASSTESEEYALIKSIVSKQYPGVSFVPALIYGGTDSRYYCDLTPTKSVYRFQGLLYDERWGNWHQVNEKTACDVLENNVDFYVQLVLNYGKKN